MISATVGERKTILRLEDRTTHDYDLASDPHEIRPLPRPRSKKADSPYNQLLRFYGNIEIYESKEPSTLSAEDAKRLRDLGYLNE